MATVSKRVLATVLALSWPAAPVRADAPTVVTVPLIRSDLLRHPTDWRGGAELGALLAAAWPESRVSVRYKIGVPFERGLLSAQEKGAGAICVPFVRRTADREALLRFSGPIVHARPLVVLHRASDPRPKAKRSLAELLADRDLTLVMRKGSRFGDAVDGLIAHHSPPTLLLASAPTAPHELVCMGRGDYRLVDGRSWASVAACANGEALTATAFPDAPNIAEEGIACSRATPAWIVEAIDRQLQADGEAKQGLPSQ